MFGYAALGPVRSGVKRLIGANGSECRQVRARAFFRSATGRSLSHYPVELGSENRLVSSPTAAQRLPVLKFETRAFRSLSHGRLLPARLAWPLYLAICRASLTSMAKG